VATAWKTVKVWAYLAAYVVPLLVVAGLRLGGAASFLTPVFTFVLIPLLDLIVGEDRTNSTPGEERTMEAERYYRVLTWLYVPVAWAVLVLGLHGAGSGGWAPFETVGNVSSLGILGAVGIVVAHELGHKPGRFEKLLAKGLLHPVFYGHFTREHNLGHHLLVSTPEDPSSARLGESFYRFYPRAVGGAFRKAMELEAERLRRDGRRAWDGRNEIYRVVLIPLVLLGGAFLARGPRAAAALAASAVIAFSLLETVNYLEHYGLERRRLPGGKYERVTPLHSWNSNHLVTNCFLFHLQRHSDHHAWPARRCQILRDMPEAPQLPTGYAGMILLAVVPPLWFRVMDRRVKEFARRQQTTPLVEGIGITV
jgi:alkane 1-monooxygenase